MSKKAVKVGPDKHRLEWPDYFMGTAVMVSMRSPDPNTKVGAIVVNADNKILATGYNGLPKNISVDDISWAREGEELEKKYAYVLHAEINSLLNAQESLEGCTMFVTLYPCNECAKIIIQKGIKKVYYLSNPYENTWPIKASQKMFKLAGVKIEQFKPQRESIEIRLKQ